MSERVQVLFRWDKAKLEQLKAWAASERLTLQEVLETLATKFLESRDRSLIIDDSNNLSTNNSVIASLITRLEQVENAVASQREQVAVLQEELGEPIA
jgi:hypothetical protein